MKLNLPLHPTKTDPRTGLALRAVGVLASGRICWPILGASPDDPADAAAAAKKVEDDAAAAAAAAKKTEDDAAAAKKAADDAAAAEGGKKPPPPTELQPDHIDYFPANTAPGQMSDKQRAAYYKWHSQRHEARATEWYTLVGGGQKTAQQVHTELEEQRKAGLSSQEKAVEEAFARGKQETTSTMSAAMATLAFETAMAHVPEADRPELLSMIDRQTVIKEDGTIDTAKVVKIVARIAPANGKTPPDPDFGGGNRGNGTSASGVSGGASRYREKRGKKPPTT